MPKESLSEDLKKYEVHGQDVIRFNPDGHQRLRNIIEPKEFTDLEVKTMILGAINATPFETILMRALKPAFERGVEGSEIVKERDYYRERSARLEKCLKIAAPGFDFEKELNREGAEI